MLKRGTRPCRKRKFNRINLRLPYLETVRDMIQVNIIITNRESHGLLIGTKIGDLELNGVHLMVIILRYFAEFDGFGGQFRQSG